MAGPVFAALPYLTGAHRSGGVIAVGIVFALFLLGAGIYVVRGSRADWLLLLLDEHGLTFRRGMHETQYAWTDIIGAQLTSRRAGRVSVPSLRVQIRNGADLFLDDVFTLRRHDLAFLLQSRAAAPPPTSAEQAQAGVRRKRAWIALQIMFAVVLILMGIGIARLLAMLHG